MGSILSVLTGLCAGIVSGSALCAFYIALGVFSKSAIAVRLKNIPKPVIVCSSLGGVFGTVITIFEVSIQASTLWASLFGLSAGIYVGIFVACLADVVNSIPVIKNYGISNNYIVLIFLGFVTGKMIGSIVYWISGVF